MSRMLSRSIAISVAVLGFLVNAFGGALSGTGNNFAPAGSGDGIRYLPDRIIVKVKPDVARLAGGAQNTEDVIISAAAPYTPSAVSRMFPAYPEMTASSGPVLSRIYEVRFSAPIRIESIIRDLSTRREFEYAEPWYIYPLSDIESCTPNDPSRPRQYHLTKIMADSAWCISSGDTSVVIGIVDTGVQPDHPDLAANIWTNHGEIPGNGIDDDNNGKIDDVHGWDFGGANYANPVEDNQPGPTAANNAHGTHVAGIASATTNNGLGIAGVGYRSKIMPVKVTSDNDTRGTGGTPYVVFGAQGIVYAAENGASVINCSWGGAGGSQFEQDIVNYATQRGALVVAAAGNSGTATSQYPAAYDNVLSVAATRISDAKASYSSYGYTVDLAAPGDTVYSAYYPSTYSNSSGTSMATPVVAGVAALVKAHNPSFTALQIGEQVRVTTDNISALNPSFYLGSGRVNALRALTIQSPSLRGVLEFQDSATGGRVMFPRPGQTLYVVDTVTNYLLPTSSGATATLRSLDPYLQIIDSAATLGVIGTLQSVVSAPLRVKVGAGVPPGHRATIRIGYADAGYSDAQYTTVLLNPTFGTHDVNNVAVSLVNNGRIGFSDFPDNSAGVGFQLYGENLLFEGGILAGVSSTKVVSVVRNATGAQDNDFSSSGFYEMEMPGSVSSQDGEAIFLDSAASSTVKIGLRVHMKSYAFVDAGDSNSVILQYSVKNVSSGVISGLYVGLFFDWDVRDYDQNKSGYDPTRYLGYAWDTLGATVYAGACALDSAAGFRGLVNNTSLDVSKAAKWGWLSGGVVNPEVGGDIHFVISSGPFTIPQNATQQVGFAVLGAATLQELQSATDAARAKWIEIQPLVDVRDASDDIPFEFTLSQNYPNPFNPSSIIGFNLSKGGRTSLRLYDVLGREVATLVDDELPAGSHSVKVDASQMASGVYFYRLTSGAFVAVKKLTIMK